MLPKYLSSSHRISSHHMSTTQASPTSIVIILAFVACLFAMSAQSASAATFTVDTLADDATKSACTAAPNDCSLRGAIAAAAAAAGNDLINFSVTGTITLGGSELVIQSNIMITGPGADLLTVSGNNASRVFFIGESITATLDGLKISGGNGQGLIQPGGGGIYINRGALTLTNSTVSGNSVGNSFSGGGIFNNFGTLTLTDTTVSGNSVTTESGGGIHNNRGTVTVTDCTISGNSAGRNGGGIANQGTMTVTNSTISGNTASFGNGGGIANFTTLNVADSTVTGNRADSDGDGIGAAGGIFGLNTETLNNSIVAGNFRGGGTTPDDISASTIDTANNNLIGDAATSGGITDGVNGNKVGNNGVGTIAINIVLNTTLAFNGGPTKTHALIGCNSPAVDAGSDPIAAGLPTDQRGVGFPRIANQHVDIGAFELQTVCNTAPTANDDGYTTNEDIPLSGNVLANDTDAENNALTAALVSGPSHADSFTLNLDGSFSYTPRANYNGSDSFTYKANDGSLDSNVATVSITVNAVNDAPIVVVAPGGSCSDAPNISGTMNLTVGDVESPADTLTLGGTSSNTALVPNANIVFGGSGSNRTIKITVASKQTGTATITVIVSDGQATGAVTITVIVGSDKNETLNGTAGADMIFGLGGKNTINGNAGNDLICGGNGVDTISGGDGDDTIEGGNGDDLIKGDAGNDILIGGAGNDTLNGGADNDTLTGGNGADAFFGGPGTDVVTDFTPSQGDTQNGIP
jgi:Ca2+-binding RTX toxin-like protein